MNSRKDLNLTAQACEPAVSRTSRIGRSPRDRVVPFGAAPAASAAAPATSVHQAAGPA